MFKLTAEIAPIKFITRAVIISALLGFSLGWAGCVTVDQSEQMDTKRELSALNVMYSGLLKKVDRIDKSTQSMVDDVEETKTGFASLEVETRSSLAENNAELEKFREEFGFVRGGIEESSHLSEEFSDEIASLKATQGELSERLALVEGASVKAGEEDTATGTQTRELLNTVNTRAGDIEAKLENMNKLAASLETRISALEGKKTAKKAETPKKAGRDPKALYERGHQHALKKNYSKAIEVLKAFLKANPKHELAGDAQYWLAESYFGRDDFERAILEYNKVIKNHPKSKLLDSASYKQGLSFLRLGSDKEARVIFERLIEKFPDTKVATDAKKRLKKMDLQKK
ncbi:MAG: tol-pal system protein YbgF [Thermodesulfobacteriota bacterium]